MVHVSSFGLQKNFSILNFIWKMFWCMVILSIFTTDPPGLRMEDHRFNNDYRSLIQVSQSLWVWLKKLKKPIFTISLLHSIVKDLWNNDVFDANNIDIRIIIGYYCDYSVRRTVIVYRPVFLFEALNYEQNGDDCTKYQSCSAQRAPSQVYTIFNSDVCLQITWKFKILSTCRHVVKQGYDTKV